MSTSDFIDGPPSVLVIEHNRFLCEMICAWLQGSGYITHPAGSEPEALAAIERHRFDIVLLDLDLHRLEGASLLRSVRGKLTGVPLVLLVGAAGFDDVLAVTFPDTPCVKLGKPYSFFTLGLVMEAALNRARGERPESGVRRSACD